MKNNILIIIIILFQLFLINKSFSNEIDFQATDIEIHAKEILLVRERLNKILAESTGQKLENIGLDTERDNFMSAEESVEYGLIDSVSERRLDASQD